MNKKSLLKLMSRQYLELMLIHNIILIGSKFGTHDGTILQINPSAHEDIELSG